jgi:hypothetical protein
MTRNLLLYGGIGGAIIGTMLFTVTVMGVLEDGGMALGYAMMLIALSTIFLAIKRQRDDQGGVIRFWPALMLGIGISAIAGIFYVVAWEAATAVAGGDFIGDYARNMIEAKRAAGASAAELARYTAEMETLKRQYADPLFRMPMTFAEIFPVGVLVSLVSAALLRNPRFLATRRSAEAGAV